MQTSSILSYTIPIPQYKEPPYDQSLLLRPLLVTDDAVCTGFKEGEWKEALNV